MNDDATERRCVVRLTEPAIEDLHRLHKKDPSIVRDVFKKLLLLEKSPEAGEPLLGALVGFRKFVVRDRAWRIIWRVTEDSSGIPVLDISEVWAIGARADSEVYDELTSRVAKMSENPALKPLSEIVQQMGRLYASVEVTPEPAAAHSLPEWMLIPLREQLHLSEQEIAGLNEPQAQQRLAEFWSRPAQ